MLKTNSQSFDYWGYFNNAFNGANVLPGFKGYVNLGDGRGNQFIEYIGASRASSADATVFSLDKVSYPTGGWTTIELEPNTFEYKRYDGNTGATPEYVSKEFPVNVNLAGDSSGTIDLSQAVGKVTAIVSFSCGGNDGCAAAKNAIGYEKVWFSLQGLRRDLTGSLTCRY